MDTNFINDLVDWFNINPVVANILTKTLRIILIFVLSFSVYILLRYLIGALTNNIQKLDNEEDSEFDNRTKTILRFVRSIGVFVIIITAILTTLDEVGINIAPLIASVGVAGLALGLGAQTLVKDAIAGFFILLEDQFSVGDAIEVNGLSGTVEELKLRTTHMRDLRGTLHIIPNGEIRTVSNLTNDWSRAVIDITVPYEENVKIVMETLNEVAVEVGMLTGIGDMLKGEVKITGVDGFKDHGMVFRVLATVDPGQQWAFKRTMRRRVHEAFEKKGIRFAVPARRMIQEGIG